MCRLFGCRSRDPSGVGHELLHASNALRVQSREHPDGWGLGWYEGSTPRLVRSLSPAHGDGEFEKVSSFVHAQTVVAHVRRASIGRVAPQNTHPFRHGRWLFLHNGTLPRWGETMARIEEAIDPALRRELRGETDSERCFLVFLTRLALRCNPEKAEVHDAAVALDETVTIARAASERDGGQASTTFLLTDGEMMIACRRGRTLHVAASDPDRAEAREYVALASENPGEPAPGGRKGWALLPEGALVTVDRLLRLRIGALSRGA